MNKINSNTKGTEYRVQTRFGYFSAACQIGQYKFEQKLSASFQGADVFVSKGDALRAIKRQHLINSHVTPEE